MKDLTKLNRLSLFVRAAAAAAVIASTSSHAQWWNSQDPTPPKFKGTQWAEKVVYDRAMKDRAYAEASAATLTGNFEKVDKMYEEFIANGGLRKGLRHDTLM